MIRTVHVMKIGIYFDLRNPPAWQHDPASLYGTTLEMCEEAERLGADSIWVSEHHAFEDGYLPQPFTMAAAIAARTSRVRIGTAIAVAPFQHPVHLAEQAAVVDLISGGRFELGIGAGYSRPEFALFGADIERRYDTTDDRCREVRRLWDDVVQPRPVQHDLPIWMGYAGPAGARRAGRLGARLLTPNHEMAEPYLAGLDEGGHDRGIARMGGNASAWVTDDPERDWPTARRHLAHMFDTYRSAAVAGTGRHPPRPVDPDRLITTDERRPLGAFRYGTPEQVAPSLRQLVGDAPVETLLFWASIAGMKSDMVARNIELVCTKVGPLLADVGFDATGD